MMDIAVLFQSLQYLLPVTIAILGLSIFLFGFQSVKEPDYSYINNIVTTRKKKQQPPKKNGIITASKPTTPIIAKPKAEASAKSVAGGPGKENAQPVKKPKKPVVVDDAADLEEGDWLPAPVRGTSNRKASAAAAAKQQSSPKKVKGPDSLANKKQVLKEVQNKVESEVVAKEELIAQKKGKKEADASVPLVAEEPVTEDTVVVAPTDATVVDKKQSLKKANKVEKGAGVPDSPNLWEESKSRGNRKARARKD